MENNNDKALEIAEVIEKHRKGELKMYAINNAVGMANVYHFGKEQRLWLVHNENFRGSTILPDAFGSSVVYSGPRTTYQEDGLPVYKNTRIGEIIIRNSTGSHEVMTPKGLCEITVYNNAFYGPAESPRYACDITINLNEKKPRYYRDLTEIIKRIDDLDKTIIEAEKQKKVEEELIEQQKTHDTQRRDALIEKIQKTKQEKEEAFSKMQSFIRKSAELRYQPILDPWQEEVKRSFLFDATMAIDGGPGTGKTTSLIQRMKFLTDSYALEEYLPNLSKVQKDKLTDTGNWIFYSPSQLLKQYLKNNMSREGLLANDDTVKVWENQKTTLIKKYNLINSDTQNPFLVLRKRADENFLPYDDKRLKKVIQAFETFFLNHQNEKLNKLIALDVSPFKWKNEGKSIQGYINRQDKAYDLEGLIRLYFNIEENFALEVKDITKPFNKLLTDAAGDVFVRVERNQDIIERLTALFDKWKKESSQEEDAELSDIDDVIEEENELEEQENDFEIVLLRKLKTLIRKAALIPYDKNYRLAKRDKELTDLVEKVININSVANFTEIGQLSFFTKYFDRITKGIRGNLVSEIPMLYKAFRKKALKDKVLPLKMDILQHIVEKESEKNKRIHPEEQAFLIYFINNLIKRSYKVSKLKTNAINHPYFEAYREMCKPVIGIDEATDFHLIDLLCIYSLGDAEISSVTFSGDLMQRLTNVGIRDWSELKTFIPKFEVKELLFSYRQSPTLLQLAQNIYQIATSKKAEYLSYMDFDEKEPKPLLYVNEDEEESIKWIANRILEIYTAYGNNIPSIAVFLPEENKLQDFASKLGDVDELADVDIKVMACSNGQILGDDNTVRVFSIEFIKGLEFEAVFFHHIDEVINNYSTDLMFKNLYVGLSRATFYLGITSKVQVDEIAQLPKMVNNNDGNWKISKTN